jgi:hypothetical protein
VSHIECPDCKTRNHVSGYGLAAGPMGQYTFCEDCGELLEFDPDVDDFPEDDAAKIIANCQKWRDEKYPNGLPEGTHMRPLPVMNNSEVAK